MGHSRGNSFASQPSSGTLSVSVGPGERIRNLIRFRIRSPGPTDTLRVPLLGCDAKLFPRLWPKQVPFGHQIERDLQCTTAHEPSDRVPLSITNLFAPQSPTHPLPYLICSPVPRTDTSKCSSATPRLRILVDLCPLLLAGYHHIEHTPEWLICYV